VWHPAVRAKVLGLRSLTIGAADTLAVRLRDSEELLDYAMRTDDQLLRFHAVFQRTGPLLELGAPPRSPRSSTTPANAPPRSVNRSSSGWSSSRAGLALMLGDIPTAEARAERALKLGVGSGRRIGGGRVLLGAAGRDSPAARTTR